MKRILTSFPRWMAMLTLAAFLFAVASPASAQDAFRWMLQHCTLLQLFRRLARI